MRHLTPNESYNIAIDDAKAALAREIEKTGNEECFKLFVATVARLDKLKRPIYLRPNRRAPGQTP